MTAQEGDESAGQRALQAAARKIATNRDALNAKSRTTTFNWITIAVIGTHCLYIIGLAFWVTFANYVGVQWKPAFDALLDLLKVGLIPIASTVLGYYIGQSRK